MPSARFTILGPARAWHGRTELDLGGRQQRLVLALLLARAGHTVTVSDLVDVIWENEPPQSAVNVVHRYIGTLRRLIEPDLPIRAMGTYLVGNAGGYQLKVDDDALDLLRFRRLVQKARQQTEQPAVGLYAEALALWRGPCASGLEPVSRTHPTFVAIEAERAQVLRNAADAALSTGQAGLVLPALRQAVDRSPLDEPLQARLITALAAEGLQAEAVEAYQAVRRHLDDALGIPPGPELTKTYERLLQQRLTASSQRLTHRPEWAHVDAGSPRPPDPGPPSQLPPRHPNFAGRDGLLHDLMSIVEQDRLCGRSAVTLAVDGMPGVGKTITAVHLAHRLSASFPDGQLFADLRGSGSEGPARNPHEVLRGFLRALGVPDALMPAELHGLAGLYRSILAGRRTLLVLDNAKDFAQVRHLLPTGDASLAIITSRVRIKELVTNSGAHPVTVALPTTGQAQQILTRRLGLGIDTPASAATGRPCSPGRIKR